MSSEYRKEMQNLLDNHREIFAKEFEKVLIEEKICIKTLEITSKNCGFDQHYHKLLFQGGVIELLSFLSKFHNKIMLSKLYELDTPQKITKRISLATKISIKLMDKIILQKIVHFYMNPLYLKSAIKQSFNSCDAIWRYAGDRSIDYNFYTKRTLLLSVYLPSLMHYLGDESLNYEKTDLFIDSSLEKIVKLATLKARIKFPKIEDIPILRMFI